MNDVHALLELTAHHAAHADTAHVLGVVDGGDQHLRGALGITLGSGNVLQDGIEQGLQVNTGLLQVQRGGTLAGRHVHDGVVQGGFVGLQVDQQVEDLAGDLLAALVGAVDLVDDDQHLQAQLEGLLQHEAGLGHGAFEGVHQQQHAVHHLEDALHLAAEVSVAGGVNDVDLGGAVVHGGVLGQDGNAALALDVAGVHHAVNGLLILVIGAALLEHLVDQGGLAVVNVGNDGNVANVFADHGNISLDIR